jgi:taurine dioxygenase
MHAASSPERCAAFSSQSLRRSRGKFDRVLRETASAPSAGELTRARRPAHNARQETATMETRADTPAPASPRGSGLAGAPAAIEVLPSGAALGAEIRGIDLSQPVPDAIKAALRVAWAEHLVLLFRGQDIDDDQLLAASGIFGPPHEAASRKYHLGVGKQVDNQYMISKHPSISIVSNLGPDGNPVKDNGSLGSYEVVWHTDNSYVEVPPAGSMLYSLEIPANGGGDTWFSNQYLAYEELPADLKRAIEGKAPGARLEPQQRRHSAPGRENAHAPGGSRGAGASARASASGHPAPRAVPRAPPRLAVELHHRMPNEESERLLDKLWEHATQPKYAWGHQWRVGDIVLWDNRCCMHYRSEVDPAQRRVMHRTTIRGGVDYSGLTAPGPVSATDPRIETRARCR